MAKSNKGGSYPNQGDRKRSMDIAAKGKNVTIPGYSQPAKQDAKRWKSKGNKNPKVPDWLA